MKCTVYFIYMIFVFTELDLLVQVFKKLFAYDFFIICTTINILVPLWGSKTWKDLIFIYYHHLHSLLQLLPILPFILHKWYCGSLKLMSAPLLKQTAFIWCTFVQTTITLSVPKPLVWKWNYELYRLILTRYTIWNTPNWYVFVLRSRSKWECRAIRGPGDHWVHTRAGHGSEWMQRLQVRRPHWFNHSLTVLSLSHRPSSLYFLLSEDLHSIRSFSNHLDIVRRSGFLCLMSVLHLGLSLALPLKASRTWPLTVTLTLSLRSSHQQEPIS